MQPREPPFVKIYNWIDLRDDGKGWQEPEYTFTQWAIANQTETFTGLVHKAIEGAQQRGWPLLHAYNVTVAYSSSPISLPANDAFTAVIPMGGPAAKLQLFQGTTSVALQGPALWFSFSPYTTIPQDTYNKTKQRVSVSIANRTQEERASIRDRVETQIKAALRTGDYVHYVAWD